MKKTYNAPKPETAQKQRFRRFAGKMFGGLPNGPGPNYQAELRRILELLQEIDESIAIIARQIAREARRGE
jgi:hypothetical protein